MLNNVMAVVIVEKHNYQVAHVSIFMATRNEKDTTRARANI
jgi:hypothetical protein